MQKHSQIKFEKRIKNSKFISWIKGQKSLLVYFGLVLLVVALNVAAWNSTAFSDWYIAYIFPIWLNTYGRITGLFPFSVGEWLIVAGVLLLVLAVLMGLVWGVVAVVGLVSRVRSKCLRESAENKATESKVAGFKCFSKTFYRFFAWTLVCIALIMTLNCYILYHASTFSEHYFGEDNGDYDLVELIELYNMVALKCNEYAKTVDRDENGVPVYVVDGQVADLTAMADMARENMQKLGESYPQLDGYYPRPKAMFFSDFMCQQYMCGYYFPFSLEANYNDVMYLLNIPSTMCHELAHLRGYIFEDEANFISYLACTQSEHEFFQYAGYINVLVYLNNDIYKAWEQSRTAYDAAVAVVRPIAVDEQVWVDNTFVADEEWDRINGKAILDTEVVESAADVFVDTNLKVNGVTDGAVSYSRVVRLLMQYHRSER